MPYPRVEEQGQEVGDVARRRDPPIDGGGGGGEDENAGGIPAGLRGRGGRWAVTRQGEAAGAASRRRGWGEDGIGEEEDDGRVCCAEEEDRSLIFQTRVICVHLFC